MASAPTSDLHTPSSPDFSVTLDLTEFYPDGRPFSGSQIHRVEILSEASREGLAQLLTHTRTRQLAAGEVLFSDGQSARSVYVVRSGSLVVRRSRGAATFAEVRPGEWLGLFGLLAGRRRACQVQADQSAELTELEPGALVRLLNAELPVREAAKRHFHERLARLLCGSHPLFTGVSGFDRAQLARCFTALDLKAEHNQVLVQEEEAALYVIAHGQLRLSAPDLSESTALARGHLFGLSGGSVAIEPLTRLHLLRLSPEDIAHPFLGELAARARARGLFVDRHLFIGDTGIPGLS